jgi:hypothetical protein
MIFLVFMMKIQMIQILINFNISAQWLNIRKDSLKRTLIESYRKNIDYKISLSKNTSVGRPSETIYLTPDCFTPLHI